MEKRTFGRTGLEVSVLTFGCGAVGGLMTLGEPKDQDRAVAWAREQGVNFFDTAASYGNGASERNLGRALGGNADGLVISTKVGVRTEDMGDVATAVRDSLDASLGRLGLEKVDLFQLHNTIGRPDRHGTLSVEQVLGDVVPAFEKLRDAGKTDFLGFTAKGEADDLHALVESGCFDSAQVFYNLLVPSAGETVRADYPAEDYRCLLDASAKNGVGAIGVRVLAGGALSGTVERHPLGMPEVAPIGSDTDYATDVARALRFQPLVDAGHADSLPELAMRYVISNPVLPTTEIGIANLDQVEQAVSAVNRGALSPEALAAVRDIQGTLADGT